PRPSQARGGTLHGGRPAGLAVGDVIGRGGASTVHRARYVATGAPVAPEVLDVVGSAVVRSGPGGGGAGGTPARSTTPTRTTSSTATSSRPTSCC
ncbi:MAG TPA: hypothetical protein VEZ18_05530, partial [Geodermatophilus sp.]|nr:hypothetical protein [Geodermatophilus sp.]